METHDQQHIDRLIDEEEERATDRYQNDLVSAASITDEQIAEQDAWEKEQAAAWWKKQKL